MLGQHVTHTRVLVRLCTYCVLCMRCASLSPSIVDLWFNIHHPLSVSCSTLHKLPMHGIPRECFQANQAWFSQRLSSGQPGTTLSSLLTTCYSQPRIHLQQLLLPQLRGHRAQLGQRSAALHEAAQLRAVPPATKMSLDTCEAVVCMARVVHLHCARGGEGRGPSLP